MIPKGWKVGMLSDILDIKSGYSFKSNSFSENGKYRLVTIKAVQDGYLELNNSDCINSLPSNMKEYCILKVGDILLSLTGNVGRCCIVDQNDLLLNQRVAKIESKESIEYPFIYCFFRRNETKVYLESISRGTAQANLSPIEMVKMPLIIPSLDVLENFSSCVGNFFEHMIKLRIENTNLSSLRDTLLPKLMSGELDVEKVQN